MVPVLPFPTVILDNENFVMYKGKVMGLFKGEWRIIKLIQHLQC